MHMMMYIPLYESLTFAWWAVNIIMGIIHLIKQIAQELFTESSAVSVHTHDQSLI